MTKEELTKSWERNFPSFIPIAHELKNKFDDRWFRIHTLPESKRYAENEEEFNEIFRRHNLILSDLFDENHYFILISLGYGSNKQSISKDKTLKELGLQNKFWLSIDVSDDTDEESYFWNLFFDVLRWNKNSLNNLFRLIAEDEIREVILFSTEKNILYHPYDGGADIIFENSELRDFYKEKYKIWLSKHPKGL